MLISVKLLTKYVIMIYALGLVHDQSHFKVAPKAKFLARLGKKNG